MIVNEDLLYSTRNSAQCYVVAWMGGEFRGEWSLCFSSENIMMLLIGYTQTEIKS